MLQSTWRNLRTRAKLFRGDERGNFVMIFALALLPIIGFIGAAVDYTRANSARSAMQAALDSAVLMLAKDAATLTPAQLSSKATAYFNAMYSHAEAKNVTITATYSASGPNGSTVKLDGAGSIDTDFMKVVGFPQLPFTTSATSAWGNTRLRVALALDNTGSMASNNKMTALKSAAKNLIDQLKATAQNTGDVYISIVPFAKWVNVGSSNYNQNWLRWDQWDDQNGSCSNWRYSTKSSCTSRGYSWTPGNHSSWSGCVTDRDQNYDVNSTAPVGSNLSTQFITVDPDSSDPCPVSLMPLSYDWTGLKNKIDDMQPTGGTNQPIGLVWAWHSLLQTAPLNAPSEDANYAYKKVIIHLSDGLNTEDRWYGNGYDPSPQVDSRQSLLCSNIKNTGVTIYTIQVNTTGDPTQAVMKNCASGDDKFFMLTSSTQILTAFNSIATSISKLRLAK
ncbi:MAG: TadE/TadG family protein [Xanthobacteraceae bacterium]|nr:MAG: TadE/TadG family protein [Xanthobacteraceae bacterium]